MFKRLTKTSNRDYKECMQEIDFGKKLKKLQDRKLSERQSLRYIKLISEIVKCIISNNDKYITNNDIKTIALRTYKKYDKIIHQRIRSMMTQEVVKKDINEALISFYSSAGLDKAEAINLLNLAKETAKEKKDVTNLLKIVEKYENAANLTQKNTVTARSTETTDFSKIGKDGQPAVKVTKTLEMTTDQAAKVINPDVIDSTNEPKDV